MAEQLGHAAVVARLRAVVAEQLRAARAVAAARTAVAQTAQTAEAAGQAALAEHAFAALGQQLYDVAEQGDDAAVARLLAAGADPNVGHRGC